MSYKTFEDLLIGRLEPKVFCILKIGQRKHLEELADGKLRFRKLSYYTSLESQGKSFFDPNEGIESVLQADQTIIKFKISGKDEIKISKENGLAGPLLIRSHSSKPILCLHAFHAGEWTHKEFTESEIPQFKSHLDISNEMRKFGESVWIIEDWEKFIGRLSVAMKSQGLGF